MSMCKSKHKGQQVLCVSKMAKAGEFVIFTNDI